nr:hypothetical protein [Tanacetum cinerariifolium]
MYTTSITKTKATRYEIVGIEDIVSRLWSTIKRAYDKDATKGIKHWDKRRKLWYRSQMNKFSKNNVYSTQKILDMLLLTVQHKLFHLNESDIVDFIVALRMFTRSLIIKHRVENLQLGVESYQKKLNITPPQQTFPEIKFKELYTPSYKPPGLDEEVALKLQAELQDEFDKEQRLTVERAQQEVEANIALIESWDDVQAKINADYQLAKKLQAKEQQELNDEENAKLFMKLLEKKRKLFAAKQKKRGSYHTR